MNVLYCADHASLSAQCNFNEQPLVYLKGTDLVQQAPWLAIHTLAIQKIHTNYLCEKDKSLKEIDNVKKFYSDILAKDSRPHFIPVKRRHQ